jgi:hypothetical protein
MRYSEVSSALPFFFSILFLYILFSVLVGLYWSVSYPLRNGVGVEVGVGKLGLGGW